MNRKRVRRVVGIVLDHTLNHDVVMRDREPTLPGEKDDRTDWLLWYRVREQVSKNIAHSICVSKINGTFIQNKRRTHENDRYLRKLDKDAIKRGLPMPSPRHQHKPYLILDGEKLMLDGRLGGGEVTIERLSKTKLGRQELGRIALLGEKYSSAIKAFINVP